MGLAKCFEAADALPFEPFDGSADIYNTHLVTPPRVYEEEPQSYGGGAGKLGVLWAQNDANAYGPSSIRFFSVLATNDYPGWGGRVWTIDGTGGRFLSSFNGADTFGSGSPGITYGRVGWEPQGHLWEFNGHPSTDGDGAVRLDVDTLGVVPGSGLPPSAFAGHDSDRIEDFAIDRRVGFDRVFVRWSSDPVARVRVYRFSTLELLHTIHAADETTNIVLTHDGFAYVADSADWLHVYDFDGRYHGSMRHPRTVAYPGGTAWGWDPFYRRLLFLGGTAHAVDGASTLRVEGFYPQPEATLLSGVVPRQVPRAGRTVYCFAHVCGDGGEAVPGRRVIATGDVASTFVTDAQGDAVFPVSPGAAGALAIDLEVP